ncbi:MAG TPA: TonB-dependent receptor [Steroidobacteraceae bacterium]|nr:TonB-dependent receptor [Steroidobacteraceae bacterium]
MHVRMLGLLRIAAPIAIGCALFTTEARAQQEATSNQLQEIVITAEKRASTVQTTPISITAITGKDLQDRGISDISQIVQSVPGISMRNSGPGQTELEMRGMTSAGGNSSTVGFYLNDIPLSAPASAQNGKVVIDPSLYDLNRVEVLRGPQGTLYGSGSMGGTIRLIPNAPDTGAFDASVNLILGGTDGGSFNHTENGMLNIPLGTDLAALRLVATQQHMSGWIDRIVIADESFPAPTSGGTVRGNVAAAPVANDYKGVNDENLESFRASLLFKLGDRLSITPFFMYQKITQDGLTLIDSNPGTNTNYQPFDAPEPFSDRIDIASLDIDYHFDFADLTSVTSYWNRDEDLRQDGAEEIATVLIPAVNPTPLPPNFFFPLYADQGGIGANSPTSLEDDRSWQTTQELRLTSNGEGPWKWLVGYFYQDFESDWDLFVYTPQAQYGYPVIGNTAFVQYQPTKIIQNAFFGEVSWQFARQWTATAGLRRFDYHGTVHTDVSGWLSSAGTADPSVVNHYFSENKDQGITPKFDLSYQYDKDLLLYATASKGFRPGGGNQPIPTSGALGNQCAQNLADIGISGGAPLGYTPDHVWSYELGEKLRAAEGRVTFNTAVYFESWSNIQQDVPLPCGFPFTGNLGNAHVYGAEVELDAVITAGFMFALNGSWSHARFIDNPVAPQTTIDNRVQNVPDWTSSASIIYRTPVNNRINFVARADNNYVGSRIDVTAQPNYLPSYNLLNLRAGVEGNHWNVMLYCNNVTNKVAQLSNTPAINVNVPTFNRTAVATPLNFGVDMSYRFGR